VDGERIVRLVAYHVGSEVHAGSPRVSDEPPETGERFEGLSLRLLPSLSVRRADITSEKRNVMQRLILHYCLQAASSEAEQWSRFHSSSRHP
jgi:Flp pilus assembly CpaF family ATPase